MDRSGQEESIDPEDNQSLPRIVEEEEGELKHQGKFLSVRMSGGTRGVSTCAVQSR